MNYSKGTIVLVPFPYTNLSQQKARPALIVSSDHYNQLFQDFILVAISSRVQSIVNEYEVLLESSHSSFLKTGLRAKSIIKCNKIITLEQKMVYTAIGSLDENLIGLVDSLIAKSMALFPKSNRPA